MIWRYHDGNDYAYRQKGVVRNGKVDPEEALGAPDGTEVSINIPVTAKDRPHKKMTFGMFAGPIQTTEEDFKIAEWHGDDEDFNAK